MCLDQTLNPVGENMGPDPGPLTLTLNALPLPPWHPRGLGRPSRALHLPLRRVSDLMAQSRFVPRCLLSTWHQVETQNHYDSLSLCLETLYILFLSRNLQLSHPSLSNYYANENPIFLSLPMARIFLSAKSQMRINQKFEKLSA